MWLLHPDEGTDWADFDILDGRPLQKPGTPLGVRFVSDQLNPSGPFPDIDMVGHVPVFSPAAVNHFRELLSGTGELHQLQCAEARLFALNVPIVEGAVDLDESDVVRFSDGRVMRITRFAFHAAVLGTRPIFRVAELPGQVFINHQFATRAVDSGLAGFGADLVWSSEDGEPSALPALPDPSRRLTVEEIRSLDARVLDDHLWSCVCEMAGAGRGADLADMSIDARAFYATRLFEWEVSNGGLHQFFFNNPEPEVVEAVAEGYERFGALEAAAVIRELVAPLAEREAGWRESLRDGRIETFFDSYPDSHLDQYTDRVGHHDIERLNYVRENPERFLY